MDWGLVINIAGALPILALGAFVLSVRPRTRVTVAFAVFALGFGGTGAVYNAIGPLFSRISPLAWVAPQLPFFVLWIGGAVQLARVFPRPLVPADRPRMVAAAGFAAAMTLFLSWDLAEIYPTSWALRVWLVTTILAFSTLYGFLLLLALRYRAAGESTERRTFALAAAPLAVYVGFSGGFGFGTTGMVGLLHAEGLLAPWGVGTFTPALALGLLWLASMRGADARAARAVAWLLLGAILAGLALSLAAPIRGGYGVARIVLTAVLAYAILRHQLLGIDVKLRWTISKSTTAGVFVAVFFLASEGAQLVFGQKNEIVGLVAAGGLVFVLAPLQRAADRLAERAVPAQTPPPVPKPQDDQEEVYRNALRLAIRDRVLTRDEERHLFRLARSLHIDANRAHELLVEVEGEAPR